MADTAPTHADALPAARAGLDNVEDQLYIQLVHGRDRAVVPTLTATQVGTLIDSLDELGERRHRGLGFHLGMTASRVRADDDGDHPSGPYISTLADAAGQLEDDLVKLTQTAAFDDEDYHAGAAHLVAALEGLRRLNAAAPNTDTRLRDAVGELVLALDAHGISREHFEQAGVLVELVRPLETLVELTENHV